MVTSHDKLFIGGEWVPPGSPAAIEVHNASTGERIGTVPEAAEADADSAVAAARRAFEDPSGWSSWEPARRAAALERLAAELEARAPEIGRLVSMQNGMPVAHSPLIEGMTPVGTLRYVAGLLASSPVEEETARFLGGNLVIRHEPVGEIAGIVPWNYPQTLSSFKYAPALAAGNTIVLKPSPETVLDSYVFAEAVIAAGLPPGVVAIVPGGRELGGKSAAIILDGARLVAGGGRPAGLDAGGVKSSGLGRELGPGAIAAYQNLKNPLCLRRPSWKIARPCSPASARRPAPRSRTRRPAR